VSKTCWGQIGEDNVAERNFSRHHFSLDQLSNSPKPDDTGNAELVAARASEAENLDKHQIGNVLSERFRDMRNIRNILGDLCGSI